MYGLADCNNFFVSCERLFRPDLNGKAVVVLSNNDGCAIARSNEAKALGIKMGQPLYQFSNLVFSGKVTVFSSNFMLYGDISHRVHATLREAVPAIEIYSIDEAFLDLTGIPDDRLDSLGHRLNRMCMRNVGVPVSVGISHTKTLAKIASKLCKQYPRLDGACFMKRPQDIEKVLRKFPVEDVWGIGRRYAARLHLHGVSTAFDFASLPEEWKGIDVLINNAGLVIGVDKEFEGSLDEWDIMIDTNIRALLAMTRLVVPGMVARGRGHIINIGSIAGDAAYPGGSVYCATKAAVKALSDGLRIDLVDTPLRVTNIKPGMVETNFTVVRYRGDKAAADAFYKGIRPLTGDDIALTVYFAASLPEHIQLAELLVMPTNQATGTISYRKKE